MDEITTYIDEVKLNKQNDPSNMKNITIIIYGLQVLQFFLFISSIIGVVVNYAKLESVKGTWLESHFRWQIKSFWIYLVLLIIGAVTVFLLVGYVVLFINFIYSIYRIYKGWSALSENKPII